MARRWRDSAQPFNLAGMRVSRQPRPPRHGLARVLSKRGLCSRSEGERLVAAGRVRVDGRVVLDPEFPISDDAPDIRIDAIDCVGADAPARTASRRYLMLNKPRGLLTTASDERGRDTVYRCLDDTGAGWLAPVGRLDKASEGLLLFGNDPRWAARITDPATGPSKLYHVQVDTIPDAALLAALVDGVDADGERLRASSATLLRHGDKRAWLEITLDEGRNRQIRRLLAAFDVGVLRLLRVAIGGLALGDLPKGQWRWLTDDEVRGLAKPTPKD